MENGPTASEPALAPVPIPSQGPEAMLSIRMIVADDEINDFRKYSSKNRNADYNNICGFWEKNGKKVEKTKLNKLDSAAGAAGVGLPGPSAFVYAPADDKTGDRAYTFYYDLCKDEHSFEAAYYEVSLPV